MTRRTGASRPGLGRGLLLVALLPALLPASAAAVSGADPLILVAGTGTEGSGGDGGPADAAQLSRPRATAMDAAGNVFIGMRGAPAASAVRRVAPDGVITRFAGVYGFAGHNGDGIPATGAWVNGVSGLATDASGAVYLSDELNSRIRKVDASGTISTLSADVQSPLGMTIDGSGNLYVAELGRHRIVRISPAGAITVLAGTGTAGFAPDGAPAASAQLDAPGGVALGPDGRLYFTDRLNYRVRRIEPNGTLSTVAGTGTVGSTGDGGPAIAAQVTPTGVAVDRAGNVYVSEGAFNRVRRIDRAGIITTIAGTGAAGLGGTGGPAGAATLNIPYGLTVTPGGSLLVAEEGSHVVRRIVNAPPSAAFTATPASGAAPLAVSLDAGPSADSNDAIIGYRWDFGDGTAGEGRTAAHTYAAAGTYTVRLTVMDDSGATASAERAVSIAAAPTPPEPELRISGAAFRGTWRASRVRGELVVRGSVPRPARLRIQALGPGSGAVARLSQTVRIAGAGFFTRRLALPARLLPGRYRVRVREVGSTTPLGPREASATLRPPPEGVVSRAFISTALGGKARTAVPFGARLVVANFRFAALPAKGRRPVVTWHWSGATGPVARIAKTRTRRITALLTIAGGPLRKGRYRAELRAGDRVVATAAVRVR